MDHLVNPTPEEYQAWIREAMNPKPSGPSRARDELMAKLALSRKHLPPIPPLPIRTRDTSTTDDRDLLSRPIELEHDANHNASAHPDEAEASQSERPGVSQYQPALVPSGPSASQGIERPSTKYPNEHRPVHEVKAPPSKPNSDETYKLDEHKGQSAGKGWFVPWGVVSKYCYKFAPYEYLQPLATAFFDGGKIYNREWDLYYIHSSLHPSKKPVLLVPEREFEALIGECNSAFPGAHLSTTHDHREEGISLHFNSDEPDLQPRWLGRSDSRSRLKFLEIEIGGPHMSSGPSSVDGEGLAAFKRNLELAEEAARDKSKAKKGARKGHQKRLMVNEFLRAQRYLGLNSTGSKASPADIASMLETLDINRASPFGFEGDVIFISVDCEAHERVPSCVTEVGIATLDTRDLVGIAPGRAGEDWQSKIRARHFRVLEHKDHCNKEFVTGCPDRFDFGTSEIVASADMASALETCFHAPFSERDVNGNFLPATQDPIPPRNIVLVGHDVHQDIDYCDRLGFSILGREALVDSVDTASLYRAFTRCTNTRSLGNILGKFDFMSWHLHNAGNDAVCTLWIMLAMVVSDAAERGTTKDFERREADLAKRIAYAENAARDQVSDDASGWEFDGDGGDPVSPSKPQMGYINGKPVFGPVPPPTPPPSSTNNFWTKGGVPLDV